MRYLSIILAVPVLFAFPAAAAAGSKPLVQLTAVTVSGSASSATLTVRQGPVDLADLAVTDMEGEATPLSSASRIVQTGATVQLHWEKAASPPAGSIAIPGHVLSSTDDQLLLLYEDAPHDAVAWTNGDGEMAKAEATDLATLVEDAMWSGAAQKDAVALPDSKRMLRPSATDTDGKADWKADVVADETTPGLPGSGAADLVMLAVAGTAVLRSGLVYLRRFRG